MIYCTKCGSQVNTEFCGKCGTKAGNDSAKAACSNCGAKYSDELIFCEKCGHRLKKSSTLRVKILTREEANKLTDEHIVIPHGYTEIAEEAFISRYEIVRVTMPDSINIIGVFAFGLCLNLVNIELSENITNIGNHAFAGCVNLENIKISDNVANIGDFALSCCDRLVVSCSKNSYAYKYCMKHEIKTKIV